MEKELAIMVVKICHYCRQEKPIFAFFLDCEDGIIYICPNCFLALSESQKDLWQKMEEKE